MPGLPKKYIKKYGVSKKAWREYRKAQGKGKRRSASRSRPSPKPRRRSTSGSKRKVSSVSKRRGFLSAQTIMKFARIGALVAPAAAVALSAQTPSNKVAEGIRWYTGFNIHNGTWSWQNLLRGWTPYVATSLITHGISKLSGIIRRL